MFKSSINQHRTALGEFQISSTRKGDRCTNCTLSEHTKQGTKGSLWGGIFPWSLRNDLDILGRHCFSNADLFQPVTLSEKLPTQISQSKVSGSHTFVQEKSGHPIGSRRWFHHIPPTYCFAGSEILHQLIHGKHPTFFLKGFNLPRWCRVSSIHSSNPFWEHLRPTSTASKRWWPATA